MKAKARRNSLVTLTWRIWCPATQDEAARRMGWRFLYVYLAEKLKLALGMRGQAEKVKSLGLKFLGGKLYYRPMTSDLVVLKQVFLDEQFSSSELPEFAETIIDAGANCGYSTIWFAWKYPSAKVYALEPDMGNFQLLKKNFTIYADRIVAMQAALWHEDRDVYVHDLGFRGGGNWALQVQENSEGRGEAVPGISPARLISKIASRRADIFKIDIEGGEVPILLHEDRSWLDHVRCLLIELHDDVKVGEISASVALVKALSGRPHQRSDVHENTVIRFD